MLRAALTLRSRHNGSVTRIIAGELGGRRIEVPRGPNIRPTADRVREALFSRLDHENVLSGACVLDLFAGSGALGLEAASRGARTVLCVESSSAAARVIGANIAVLGVQRTVTVAKIPVATLLATTPAHPWDLVLMDPPYAMSPQVLAQVLGALMNRGWLTENAVVVVERGRRSDEPCWPDGLERFDERGYGQTRLWFAEAAGDEIA